MESTETQLWYIGEDGRRRLMNTIKAGSRFFGFKAPDDLHLEENRQKCAEILRDGWRNQGGMIHGKWEIKHVVAKELFFARKNKHV